jgi:hypothetical protein
MHPSRARTRVGGGSQQRLIEYAGYENGIIVNNIYTNECLGFSIVIEAVEQCKYKPYLLNGQGVGVEHRSRWLSKCHQNSCPREFAAEQRRKPDS